MLETATALARRIAAMPPLAVAALRGARLHALFQTVDHAEAVAAFTEKRPARFSGS